MDTERLERMLEVIAAATAGDYEPRVPVEDLDGPLLELEVGVNFLLDELQDRARENERQHQSLRDQSQQLLAQAEALVTALSTPIITLWPGVLILPLIGTFDRERATRTTEVLLERVAAERARHVLLDLTGVEAISTDTGAALVSMIRAAQLLGVRCLVTGINPNTAKQLIELDADLGRLQTLARVSDALELVLAKS